ncbi:MAG TPA: fibronectin type III domain-containing protein, partial [Verrucomicrobiae bacterium]|nr:fibronectin type III domain-containing protein [Verrucomicrobiae bacterium]
MSASAATTSPTNLSVTSKSFQQVSLAWTDNSTSEKNVVVSRSLQATSGYVDIATLAASATSYTDTAVTPGATYYYQVSSVAATKARYTSSSISVITPSVAIVSPTSGSTYTSAQTISATASINQTDNAAITKTEFYDGGALMGTVTTSPYTLNWPITAANNGSHTWTTKAYDSVGGTSASTPVNVVVDIPCTYTLSATSSPTIASTGGSGSFTVTVVGGCSWTTSTPATWIHPTVSGSTVNYTVDLNSSSAGRSSTITILNGTATVATYTVTQAVDTTAPTVPTGLTPSVISSSQINLSWSASTDTGGSGLAGYKIYRSGVLITTTTATSYSNTGLAGSTTYSFTVAAYDNAGNISAQSTTVSATTPAAADTTAPSVPTGLTGSAVSSTQINLSWSASTDTGGSGLAGYKIYKNGVLLTTTASTSYSVTGLSPSTTYSFTVAAYDNAGNISPQSTTVSATTPAAADTTAPTVPTGLTGSAVSSSQVNLGWSASTDTGGSGLAGYKIYKNGVLLTTTASTSYSATGLSPSTTYTFTVAAYDNAGNTSAQSTGVSVTTQAATDTTPPSVPTGLTASVVSSSTISLSWNASTDSGGSGLAGYNIYSSGVVIASSTTASAVLRGLSASTTYSLTVAAYDNAGNTSAQSAAVLATTQAALTITTASPLPSATVGTAYSGTFTATGGTTPYTWSISAGSLPAGLTLSSGGVLSGTPTAATTASFTVQCTGGSTITKTFSLTVNAAAVNYTVATSASPVAGGTTTPNGTFSSGSTVTAQATVNAGYSFVNWTQNGTTVSTSPSYSFQLNGNVTLVANFTAIYTITGTASPSNGGTISGLGNGLFISGTTVSLTANPASGYSFSSWTENGSVVSSTPTYSFTATANRNLVANFTSTSSTPGKYLWSWVHGGASQDDGRAVAVDKRDGSVLLTGDFSGSVSFGGATISGTSGTSVMLAKYAANGTYQWAVAPSGSGVSQGQAVAVDTNGNVFVTGYFANTINFGAPSGAMTSAGWYDIFVAKYSPAGVCLWSKQFGSPTSGDNQGDESGYALAVDSAGNVIVGGSFDGTANFS